MTLDYHPGNGRRTWQRRFILAAILLFTVIPPGYVFGPAIYSALSARYHTWALAREGHRRADDDWTHQRAAVFGGEPVYSGVWDCGSTSSEAYWDPLSRIRFVPHAGFGWESAYAARVGELLRERGTPPWACPTYPSVNNIPCFLPRDLPPGCADHCAQQVSTLPATITPEIEIRSGPVIAATGFEYACDPSSRVFVIQDPSYPNVVMIHAVGFDKDNMWHDRAFIFADDGRLLARTSLLFGAPVADTGSTSRRE